MMTEKTKSRLSQGVRWAGTLASSGLFLWLLVQQDWALLFESFRLIPAWLLLVAFALYFVRVLLGAFRWYLLVRVQQIHVPFIEMVKMTLAGSFASNFLPSTIGGDALRILSLMRYTSNRTLSVASVVTDRLMNMAAMAAGLPFVWATFGMAHLGSDQLAEVSGAGFLLWKRVWKRLGHEGRGLWKAVRLWSSHPYVLAGAFLVSCVSVNTVFSAIWILARQLGMDVHFSQVAGVAVITYAMTILPISVNGVGLREVTMTGLYLQLGATLEQATVLVLLTRTIVFLETLPGALWFSDAFKKREGKWQNVRSGGEEP